MKFPFLLKATKHSILTMLLMKMSNKTSFFSKSPSLLLIAALKVIMAQYLHMDRLAQEKLLQFKVPLKLLMEKTPYLGAESEHQSWMKMPVD